MLEDQRSKQRPGSKPEGQSGARSGPGSRQSEPNLGSPEPVIEYGTRPGGHGSRAGWKYLNDDKEKINSNSS